MEQNKQSAPQNAASEAAVRRQKLADLKAAGHDPFTITKCKQDAFSADLKEEYKDLPAEEDTGRMVSLAGRMMSKRVMGKASFAHLRDAKGDIQIFVKRDLLGDEASSSVICWAMKHTPHSKRWMWAISLPAPAKCSAPKWAN